MGAERRATWAWGVALVAFATALRLVWVLAVPTVPVSDFAMYRESANYLSEFGVLDPGFIYMPGFVALLAWIKDLGGDLLAQKLAGVAFGGVGAAGMFVLVRALLDVTDAPDPDEGSRGRGRRLCPCPWAALATSAYALWPAGIAMSSVVGTDMPAAALLVAALALLVHLSQLSVRRRTRSGPWIAAVVFGVTSGLAAWVRAVALPLAALAVFVWLARGERLVRALLLTAVGVAATLLVLLPWGIRHLRQSGELYFTDDHGGITALIGANPNSEGAYTRALNQMFKDVTGRSVLDEPHRTTDRAAYEIAREWWRFAPGYTLGLAVKKADRLFDPEHRLLYWPIFRPGVLVGRPAAFFGRHRDAIVTLADGFGLALLGLALAGIALAGAAAVTALRGRPARPAGAWRLLALVPFQLALTATYVVFFAEPRYRLPIEMLAFPFAALAVGETARTVIELARRPRASWRSAALRFGPALALLVVWRLAWPAVIDWGAGLRARHRWAVTEVAVGPATRMLLWAPAPPLAPVSPLAGAPNGVHFTADSATPRSARLLLGGGPLPAGRYLVQVSVEAEALATAPATPLRLRWADAEAEIPAAPSIPVGTVVTHPGGPLAWRATLSAGRGSVWITAPRITPIP